MTPDPWEREREPGGPSQFQTNIFCVILGVFSVGTVVVAWIFAGAPL